MSEEPDPVWSRFGNDQKYCKMYCQGNRLMQVHNKTGSMLQPELRLVVILVKLVLQEADWFRGIGNKCIYLAVIRWCSLLNLWFSSSSLWLWRSKAFPLCRLWISNSLTASAGSGTALSSTEPSLNWKQEHDKSASQLLITTKPCTCNQTV